MEKNFEERFQQLLEGYRREVKLYNAFQESCDECVERIDKQIARLRAKRDKYVKSKADKVYPHYTRCLLPQVMVLLNEAVAERGYQFETEGFKSFGLTCESPVFQDHKRSQRSTTAYFEFRPSYDGIFCLKVKPGEYKNSNSIAAMNDTDAKMVDVTSLKMLLDHIEECERREPPTQLTEDEVVEKIHSEECFNLKYVPQSLWTYRTITESMKSVIHGKKYSLDEEGRIPAEIVDRELFQLGLRAGVHFYSLLPIEKLESLGAFDEDFFAEQIISRRAIHVSEVPVMKMTTAILKKVIPGCGWWYAKEWATKCNHLMDQEVADLLVCESLETFRYIPEKFRSLEMCIRAYKCKDKDLRSYIPKKFLTETGRLKRKA